MEVETSRAFAYPLTATEGAAALPAVLSERQIQVLVCVAQGLQNKEIATELRIEPGTVHAHLQRAFKKLAVHRKAEALEKLLCPTFPRAPEVPQIGTAEDHFRNSWPQTWREVQERFGTEQACQDFLAELRWGGGFSCPRCNGRRAWRTARGLYFCQKCHRQTSVQAGTLFQKSRIPLQTWFRAIWEIASNPGAITAEALQKMLGARSRTSAKALMGMLRPGVKRVTSNLNRRRLVDRGELFRKLLQAAVQRSLDAAAQGKSGTAQLE